MYVCIHACRGGYPVASPVLLPERFGISTGEIPLHLRLPIEWDSPEMCPYTVSCSSERLIVLLLRQAAFPLPFFSVHHPPYFAFLVPFGKQI